MRLLLDSHTALWWLESPSKIRPTTLAIINNIENEIFVSAASIWELRLKAAKGKLTLPTNFTETLISQSVQELPITWKHTREILNLPPIHKDPFDRLLIAQAIQESLTLVTNDTQIQQYPIHHLKA